MRIAQLAPLAERVPPKKYGGTERVIYTLTEELVKRGHDVTLFASGDSLTSARLRSVFARSLREARVNDPYGLNPLTLLQIGTAYASQDDFDIIHDHLPPISFPTANLARTPTVITMHGPFNAEARKLLQALRTPHIVTISKAQPVGAADFNHGGTIYNGLNMEHYPFGKEMGNYLLFVGRISMEKGVHAAIDVANELDMPLLIAAKLDNVERRYFREFIEPRLSSRVEWIGEVDEEERNKLMASARCFLHPVMWREPFGLTLIESMACGCPVVAFNKGSIPEIVKDGETGYVVEDVEEMAVAVEAIHAIDRATCRAWVLENFNGKKMADGYEALFTRLVEERHDRQRAMGAGT
ncbi:MAG TPA: glycosyltransferase family 4 protein [Candidatus Paceibacterota bacterium]|nr:glycosyltransferase family 4 protein [Candidatus Paceibacterota bacterium]